MSLMQFFTAPKGSLRQRIMASVGAMVLLSILGSVFSLSRITEVNRLLEAMNRVYIPLGRLFTQMQSDADVFHRELERSLGFSHWKDPHWKPHPVPKWIQEVLVHEMGRVSDLIRTESDWATPEVQTRWNEWASQILKKLDTLNTEAAQLYLALEAHNDTRALEVYPEWTASVEDWKKQLQWGVAEYERSIRTNFSATENRVADLRTNLEMVLIIVVIMSLLVLWLGERALRPLGDLTRLAMEITRRGVRKEDKALLPEIPLSRSDEVSQLAREFHHMATALLEREKTVENQKSRLEEQNRLLREMVDLQVRLKQAENLAAVGRMSAQVAHEVRNPLHSIGLEAEMAAELAARLGNSHLELSLKSILASVDRLQKITENYLKLSRLSDGQKSRLDMEDVLHSVLATYAPVCEVQKIEVRMSQEAHSSLMVWADRDLIEQVLGNLLRNSLQALEQVYQPLNRVTWRMGNSESGKLWLRLDDNGPGVAEDVREKLFTPFFTTRAQGTGLGLSFVKQVIEDHGGTIRCIERPYGQGACFELSLPLIAEIEDTEYVENSISG